MTNLRRKLLAAALIALGAYAGICGVVRIFYRVLLYPAPTGSASPKEHLLEAMTSDGATAYAYDFTSPGDDTVLVWLHGNAENAEHVAALAPELRSRGLGSVFVEYRGYGISRKSGKPTEQGLYADASAILDELARKGTHKDQLVLIGYSLGSGVAAEMARHQRCRALLLIAPVTSIPDIAGIYAPVLPISVLIEDRFDTLAKASEITVPTTIIHGTRDEIVPFEHGKRIARALPFVTFLKIDGGHHSDLFAIAHDTLLEAIAVRARGHEKKD